MVAVFSSIGKARSIALLPAFMIVGVFTVQLSKGVARADTLGYPWSDATYVDANYDWGYSTCPASDSGCMLFSGYRAGVKYGEADPWKYYLRNCTSYVAWKESTLGVNASGLGNGGDWYASAPASERASTPKAWDAAVVPGNPSNPYGHVAFVESVSADNSTMTISEYNHDGMGNGDTRTIAVAGSGFTEFVDFGVHPTGSGGGTSGPAPLKYWARDLVGNSGFNSDANFGWWHIYPGTNEAIYNSDNTSTSGTKPYEGDQFLATNSSQAGGSVYQDLTIPTANGQDYCATAMLTTADGSGASGGSGTLVLFNLKNGVVVNSRTTYFSGLPNHNTWKKVVNCMDITGTGDTVRVQIYPSVGGPTLGVDAVTVNKDIAGNGGFEVGFGWWGTTANTNTAIYSASNTQTGGTKPYEGNYFGATNATGAQASIYQDMGISVKNGDEYCVTAMLTTAEQSGAAGGFGDLNLYVMNGGNVVSGGSTHFANLPAGNQWLQEVTCVYATGDGNNLRVQLYPGYGSPTLGVDAVNVDQSLVANAGFELGFGWWKTYPGTNKATYNASNTLTGGTKPYEGSWFGATNSYQAGGSIYQDAMIPVNPGNEFCVTAMLTTADASGTSGGSGDLDLFAMNGATVLNTASTHFSGLPSGNQWVPVTACVNVTGSGDTLRVQIYPTPNGKTLGVDAINVL